MSLTWFGDEVQRKITSCLEDNLDLAGFSTLNVLKRIVGRNQRTRGKGTRKVGLNPSRPGKPPKRVTGFLQKSYQWERQTQVTFTGGIGTNIVGRLGSNLKYAKFLEIGTSRMKKRPHLLNSMFINKPAIIRALGRPCRGGR